MAIRHREGRASPWQCYWNNPLTGKRECANFITRAEAEKHDSLIKHRLRFERESFRREDIEEETDEVLTLEACYLHYLKEKQFNKKAIHWQMDAMRIPLQKIGAMPIHDIQHEHLSKIMTQMQTQDVKPVTVRGRLSVLRTVMRWCAEKGFCEPVRFPKLPPAHYEKLIPPTREELAAIVQVASPHIVRVVVIGSQCGVRVGPSELLRMKWTDIDIHQRVIHVRGAKKNQNAEWRDVPIRTSLVPVFSAWKDADAATGTDWVIHVNGRPISSIKNAWRETLRRAGITRRIRPYDLRHAFATEAIAAGVDIGTVANLMGHSTPTMLLKHYQFVMDGQKRAAVEALPDSAYVPTGMCPKVKALPGIQ